MSWVKLENVALVDQRIHFEAKIEQKDLWIHQLQEDVAKMIDELKGKSLAIQALSTTLMEKSVEN